MEKEGRMEEGRVEKMLERMKKQKDRKESKNRRLKK